MRICDYCGKEIGEGYLGYDINVICEGCIEKIYTKEEFEIDYKDGRIFWTNFYDD